MKDRYFPHDFFSRHDQKLMALFRTAGYAAIGYYWCLIEALHESETGYLTADELDLLLFTDASAYAACDANAMRTHMRTHNLLAITKDGKFFSNSVLKRKKFFEKKRKLAQKSAAARWKNVSTRTKSVNKTPDLDANASKTQCEPACERNAIKVKKSKVKKSKEKKRSINTYAPLENFTEEVIQKLKNSGLSLPEISYWESAIREAQDRNRTTTGTVKVKYQFKDFCRTALNWRERKLEQGLTWSDEHNGYRKPWQSQQAQEKSDREKRSEENLKNWGLI